jgi:hypothetical protein
VNEEGDLVHFLTNALSLYPTDKRAQPQSTEGRGERGLPESTNHKPGRNLSLKAKF